MPDDLQRRIYRETVKADIAERAATSRRGWLTYANKFFPSIVREEPRHITESLVKEIWRHYVTTHRDPWLDHFAYTFVDLDREYEADGRYRKVIQFNSHIFYSALSDGVAGSVPWPMHGYQVVRS
jgi:hypothetical protein